MCSAKRWSLQGREIGKRKQIHKFRLQLQLGSSQAFTFSCCQPVVPLCKRGRQPMSLAAPHILSCSPHSLCCCCCPAAGLFYYQCDISSAQTSPASLFLSSSPSTPSQSVTEQTLCYRAGESAVALHLASERHPASSSHSALGDLEYCDLHRHD